MVMFICKKCKKHILAKDLSKNGIVDISRCPSCGYSLNNAEIIKTTTKEQNLENWAIGEMIRERLSKDIGKIHTSDEMKRKIEKRLKNRN